MTTDTTRAAQLADLRNWAPDAAKAVESAPDEAVASAWADEEKRFRARMMGKTAGQVLWERLHPKSEWTTASSAARRLHEEDAAAVIAHYEATEVAGLRARIAELEARPTCDPATECVLEKELLRLVDEVIRWSRLRPRDKRPDHLSAIIQGLAALTTNQNKKASR